MSFDLISVVVPYQSGYKTEVAVYSLNSIVIEFELDIHCLLDQFPLISSKIQTLNAWLSYSPKKEDNELWSHINSTVSQRLFIWVLWPPDSAVNESNEGNVNSHGE